MDLHVTTEDWLVLEDVIIFKYYLYLWIGFLLLTLSYHRISDEKHTVSNIIWFLHFQVRNLCYLTLRKR